MELFLDDSSIMFFVFSVYKDLVMCGFVALVWYGEMKVQRQTMVCFIP